MQESVKARIKNWHREEHAEGKRENIPADILADLDKQAAEKKAHAKPAKSKSQGAE